MGIKPPAELSPEAAAVWVEIVTACPSDHFVESDGPLLERYAKAIVRCREAEAELAQTGHVIGSNKNNQPMQSPWVSVLAQAERTVATMATGLRLAPQARNHPVTTARKARKNAGTRSAYDAMKARND